MHANHRISLMQWVKKRLMRFPRAVAILNRMLWRLHRLQESYASKVSSRIEQTHTQYGFLFTTERTLAGRTMRSGDFEPDEVRCLTNAFEHAEVFVDVGANAGLFSCLAATRGLHTISVEPQQRNVRLLCKNLNDNGWDDAEVFPVALGARPGILALFGDSGTSASLVAGWAGLSRRAMQLVPVSTLDCVLGDRFARRHLVIKVDVEGGEHDVLMGGERTLHADPAPTWIVEIFLEHHHPGQLNQKYLSTFETFWNTGYEAYVIGSSAVRVSRSDVTRWIERGHADLGAYNFLFRKPE